jgi:hypothetical protein
MRLQRTLLVSAIAASLAVSFAATAGQAASGKPSNEGTTSVGAGRSVAGDGVARSKGALAVSPAVSLASTQIQSRILNYVKAHGTKYSFGSFADPATGKAVIETNAPSTVVASLVSGYGSVSEIRRTDTVDHYSRRDDVPAYWGGNGITLQGTAPSARCSSGYAVKNSAGTRFMVTAGHCFSNGQNAVTELGGRLVGTVSGNGLPSQDMEIISGQSYGSSIFVGGVNSSTGNHIASAGDPVVGYTDYCHSGRTTGEHCGHRADSVTATVCTSSGCKSPVIAFTGGYLPQGGDSGSPFYVKSTSGSDKHIRGHVIAGNGTTSYAEKWSRVAARFGVTIVS